MAIGTKSDVANQFLTGIAANTIVDVRKDLFLSSILQNQVSITGTQITNGVEQVTINILPSYTAKQRTEDTDIDGPDFNPTTTLTVAITRRPYIHIGATAQADENSLFGSRGDGDLEGLLRLHSQPAATALRNDLVQAVASTTALDTDIAAGNKFDSASTANVLDFSREFFADLNERYSNNEPNATGQNWLFVTLEDFSSLITTEGLFDNDINNQQAQIIDPKSLIYLPRYGWYVKGIKASDLHTDSGTSKKVRIATTTDSLVVAPSEMRGIINKTKARTTDGPLRFRLDMDGNMINETNQMVLGSNYGLKVMKPKATFLIQDDTN